MNMNTIILGIKFIVTFTNQFEIIPMGLHVILNIVPSFNWPFIQSLFTRSWKWNNNIENLQEVYKKGTM